MTGEEIIAEARANFGELEELTVSDDAMLAWLNTALLEVYELLPLPELEDLAQQSTVVLTDGAGALPAGLDHLLSVVVDDVPAVVLGNEAIGLMTRNPYMEPWVPVATTDGETLWVRPSDHAEAIVTHVDPPAELITDDLEDPVVLPKWHPAVVLFTTAYAYAQEEDKGQAQHYRNEALALINRTYTAPEQEALE